MTPRLTPKYETLDDLSQALAELVHAASPAISGFAAWALEHPQEMAFHSVRALANRAGVNVNTVYRLSLALGFSGFEPCREAFQSALRQQRGLYGSRAAKLRSGAGAGVVEKVRASAQHNLDTLFSAQNVARIGQAAEMLAGARRIYCVGVRSCFSLAHYMSYSGRMAFPNFARPLAEPGSIADVLTETGPEDVIVLITFSLYSAEVVRAHASALSRSARIIAITDSYTSPIAREADIVFCLPMDGPQPLPSQGAGFALVEVIIAQMITQNGSAAGRIAEFEDRLLDFGSYVPPPSRSDEG